MNQSKNSQLNRARPELLAPAGNFATLQAALDSGCDAVYFGIRGFNMRERADNFSLRDLNSIVARCRQHGVRAYLALNTIIYENELNAVQKILRQASHSGVDAIIAWDLAVIKLARELDLAVHLSTQASVANSQALELYQSLGVKRFVLARECSLKQIKTIRSKTNAEIEVFIHGALCVSESGRCFISQFLYGKSANRGECLQPCRRAYRVIDLENEQELNIENHFILSPKDLGTIEFIDQLIAARIHAFKIEGRARSPEYVKTVVTCYRQAIDWYFQQQLTDERKQSLIHQLKTVYHREFSTGFFLGKPVNEWTQHDGSLATTRKQFLGIVTNYYKKARAADILLQADGLKIGDKLLFIGPTTGVRETKVTSIQNSQLIPITQAEKGALIGLKMPMLVRRNDRVYKLVSLSG